MFQIRIHGRGGQGVVSAGEMLSVTAFLEGMHAQAFPRFGSERMGAPVMAFCRLDDKETLSLPKTPSPAENFGFTPGGLYPPRHLQAEPR